MIKLGVTGGIGSGKSFICSELEKLGIPVFYADEKARWYMQQDEELVFHIKKLFGNRAYVNWELDRKYIANIIFTDKERLQQLNELVGPVLHRYFLEWCEDQKAGIVAMEAAILFESGGYREFDFNIMVTAPLDIRYDRVMKRDECSRMEVKRRMDAQWEDEKKAPLADYIITNVNRRDSVDTLKKVLDDIKQSV